MFKTTEHLSQNLRRLDVMKTETYRSYFVLLQLVRWTSLMLISSALAMVPHMFITHQLNYRKPLADVITVARNKAARLLTGKKILGLCKSFISSARVHWLPVHFHIQFKVLVRAKWLVTWFLGAYLPSPILWPLFDNCSVYLNCICLYL